MAPAFNPGSGSRRVFEFPRDTLAHANETRWRYSTDAATGRQIIERRETVPDHTLRCFVMVRAVKQFFLHARFDPAPPPPGIAETTVLLQRVLRRSPRARSPSADPVVFPGYAGLRALSEAHADLLKARCGGAWRSYCQRGNWRMVLPVWRARQEREARAALATIRAGIPEALHVYRFPGVAINHGLLLFDAVENGTEIRFTAYDPNEPEAPVRLRFDRRAREFVLPPTSYFTGGPVRAYRVYCGMFF